MALNTNSSYCLTTSSKYFTFSYLLTNSLFILLYSSKELFFCVQNTSQRENTLCKRILLFITHQFLVLGLLYNIYLL